MTTLRFSVIIPVYNRTQEVFELLQTLAEQTIKNFEVIVIDDGSATTFESVVKEFSNDFPVRYHHKVNSGPGNSRNVGIALAKGAYVLFFDSDCLIPADYFSLINEALAKRPLDLFGGPDDGHRTFSYVQKAINHAMTSSITTGGIRGRRKQLDRFLPRSFNMGARKSVIVEVGGFSDIHPGEDPDLCYRILSKGYKVGLISEAKVYHKRRISLRTFSRQVYNFGVVRVILGRWHVGSLKWVYFLPALFVLGTLGSVLLGVAVSPLFLAPLGLLLTIIFIEALTNSGHLIVALLSVIAAGVQLLGYGVGFLHAFFRLTILGGDERQVFPSFFFPQVGSPMLQDS